MIRYYVIVIDLESICQEYQLEKISSNVQIQPPIGNSLISVGLYLPIEVLRNGKI